MTTITAPKVPRYECKQPKSDVLPRVPLRMLVVGPSNSGKTVLLVNIATNLYRGCFERIYVMSPSVDVDDNWAAVKRYQKHDMEVDDEELYFPDYNPAKLEEIIETQKQVIDIAKKKLRKMPSILIFIDDHADNPDFSRKDKLLHSLFCRGRHHYISVVVATQKLRAIAPICRCNITSLILFRLRSQLELESAVEEISAVYDKQTVIALYHRATEEPYSFLYVDLTAKTPDKMFMLRFDKYLVPTGP